MESENRAGHYYLVNLLREQSDESLQHLTWFVTWSICHILMEVNFKGGQGEWSNGPHLHHSGSHLHAKQQGLFSWHSTSAPLILIPQISDDNLFKFLRQLGVAEEDR